MVLLPLPNKAIENINLHDKFYFYEWKNIKLLNKNKMLGSLEGQDGSLTYLLNEFFFATLCFLCHEFLGCANQISQRLLIAKIKFS